MKKIFLICALFTSLAFMGFRVAIPTTGSYGRTQQLVQSVNTPPTANYTMVVAAMTAVNGNCSCGSFPVTWYAEGIYGLNPSPLDPSVEPATIVGATPVAAINGNAYLKTNQRLWPNYKIHKNAWGNYMVFEVIQTCTPSTTYTPSATYTVTNTYTSTATATTTNTFTATNTYTSTFTPTTTNTLPAGTNTYTPVSTNTPTGTYTSTATPTTTNTWTSTSTFTPTKTFTPTNTYTVTGSPTPTNTPTATYTGTWSPVPTGTFTNTPTATITCTCAASWTPACWNQ